MLENIEVGDFVEFEGRVVASIQGVHRSEDGSFSFVFAPSAFTGKWAADGTNQTPNIVRVRKRESDMSESLA